jgi:hypothetical protein
MKYLSTKASRINLLYAVAFVGFIVLLGMREWKWRFISPFTFSVTRSVTGNTGPVSITIRQYTETPVDTVRSEFGDPRKGVTAVSIWKAGSLDTLKFVVKSHYYSTMSPITFSDDHATEIFMVPNTETGLALGVGELVYLDANEQLHAYHIESSNIGDLDSDGIYEIFDRVSGTFQHLDRATGTWSPVLPKSVK